MPHLFRYVPPAIFALAFLLVSGCSTTDQLLFQQGEEQLNQRQYAQAYDTFTHYLALYPKSPGGLYNRALASVGMGRFPEAIADLDEVVHLTPHDTDIRRVRYALEAEVRRAIGEDTLTFSFQRPMKESYKSALTVFMRNDLDMILEIDTDDTWALNERGRMKHELGDFDGAVADYNSALLYCDTCEWLMYNKALSLRANWRTREAAQVLGELIEADSLDGGAWLLFGECNFALGKRKEACAAFLQAMQLGIPEAEERYNTLCR